MPTQPVYGLPMNVGPLRTRYKAAIVAAAPLSYWPMDETSGTSLVDIVRGMNAALTGGYTLGVTGPGGALPKGVSFTGGSGTVTGAVQPSLNAATWEVWFKGAADGVPINCRTPSSAFMFTMFVGTVNGSGTTLCPFAGVLADGTGLGAKTIVPIADGRWHQVVCSWSDPTNANFANTQVTIYIDGRIVTVSNGDTIGTVTVPFGNSTSVIFGNAITCSFAHLAFYGRAMGAAEVLRHYVLAGSPQG